MYNKYKQAVYFFHIFFVIFVVKYAAIVFFNPTNYISDDKKETPKMQTQTASS